MPKIKNMFFKNFLTKTNIKTGIKNEKPQKTMLKH